MESVTHCATPLSSPRFPVVLPEGWNSIMVERLRVRGGVASLRATHGDERAALQLLAEEEQP